MKQSKVTRRRLLQVSAALSAGLTLSACSATAPQPEPSGSEGQDQTPLAFRFAQAAPPLTLDPARTGRLESNRITAQVLDCIVAADTDTGEPLPSLASAWQISDDGLTYSFKLAPGISFSDGTPLSVAALLANFERWKTLSQVSHNRLVQPYHQLFAVAEGAPSPLGDPLVKEWSEDSDGGLRVSLSRPSASFLKALTQPAYGIVLPSQIGKDGYLTEDHPVGTGAYRVESWDGSGARLEANRGYRGGVPKIQTLEFLTLPDPEKRYYRLVEGSIDAYDQVALKDYASLALDGYPVQSRDPYAIAYLSINLSHPAFADALTRYALTRAIDTGKIATDYYPQGTKTATDFLPALFQMRDDEAAGDYGYRAQAAKELLEESTYSGQAIDFYYPVQVSLASLPAPEGIYSIIAQNLTAAGFNLVPKPYSWDDPDSEDIPSSHPDYGLELTGFVGSFRDPTAFLGRVLAPAAQAPSSLSSSRVQDDEGEKQEGVSQPSPSAASEPTAVPVSFESLVEAVREADRLSSVDERRKAYRRINGEIARFMPAVPLVYPVSGITQGKRVSSYLVSATGLDNFQQVNLTP